MLTRSMPSAVLLLLLIAAIPLMAGDKRAGQSSEASGAPIRLGSPRFANVGRVFAVAYSADAGLLAGGAWDGSIRVWETGTAKEVAHLHEHKGPVRKLAFAPDGKWLVSAGTGPGVCLWDLQSGRLARVLGSAKENAADVDFAPDGKQIAAIVRGRLHVWDRDGKELWRQGGDRVHVRLTFRSPDSLASVYLKPVTRFDKQMAADFKSRLHVGRWRVPADKEAETRELGPLGLARPSMPVLGADGLVAQHAISQIGQREQVAYFRIDRSEVMHRIDLTGQSVSVLCFSPDGRMLALSGDSWGGDGNRRPKFIRIFEVATGQERCRFQSLDAGRLSLAFSPDGRTLASGSLDVTVLLWDLTGGATGKPQSLTDAELGQAWNDLMGSDAIAAYRAHWKLVAAAKQAVLFLARRLHPVPTPDPKRITALVRELAADQFDTRTAAYAELSKLEDLAEPALRAGLRSGAILEAQRRMEELLRRIDQLSPERRVQLRAIEALEHMHTPAAAALLRALATGCPAASVTRAAADALRRP